MNYFRFPAACLCMIHYSRYRGSTMAYFRGWVNGLKAKLRADSGSVKVDAHRARACHDCASARALPILNAAPCYIKENGR